MHIVGHHSKLLLSTGLLIMLALSACHSPRLSAEFVEDLKYRAMSTLKLAAAGDTDPHLRAEAIRHLDFLNDEKLAPWIMQGLYDNDPGVRLSAALSTALRSGENSPALFEKLVQDEDELVRAAAMLRLLDLGAQHYQKPLEQSVARSANLRRQANAIPLLMQLSERKTISELRNWLENANTDDHAILYAAQAALLSKDDAQATRQLILQAQSGEAAAEAEAIEILSFSADPKVLYILLERLENSSSMEGRLAAARSLSKFDSQEGLGLAIQQLEHIPDEAIFQNEEQYARIRILACEACAEIGDPHGLFSLDELIKAHHPANVRIACSGTILRLIANHAEAKR